MMFGQHTGERDTFFDRDVAGLLDALVETQVQLARAIRQRDHARALLSHERGLHNVFGIRWDELPPADLAPADDDGWRA